MKHLRIITDDAMVDEQLKPSVWYNTESNKVFYVREDLSNIIIVKCLTTEENEMVHIGGQDTEDGGFSMYEIFDKITVDGVELDKDLYSSADSEFYDSEDENFMCFFCIIPSVGEHTLAFTLKDDVNDLPEYIFSYMTDFTEVIIPNKITNIGIGAFLDCTSLTSITIPNSVTTIGDVAFHWCLNIKSITIPNSVTTIGSEAFGLCSKLTGVTIGNGVSTIGDKVFENCINLEEITVDNGNAVYHSDGNCCMKDAEVVFGCKNSVIPETATTIGSQAFVSCKNLTCITIPDSVTTIGDKAFEECSSLTSITIPNSVTTIGSGAFYSCKNLTDITIPDSVTTIGDKAFTNCSKLTGVTIGNGVSTIQTLAFSYCSALTEITIPDTVTTIGSNAFYRSTKLTTIHYSGTATGAPWGATNATVIP